MPWFLTEPSSFCFNPTSCLPSFYYKQRLSHGRARENLHFQQKLLPPTQMPLCTLVPLVHTAHWCQWCTVYSATGAHCTLVPLVHTATLCGVVRNFLPRAQSCDVLSQRRLFPNQLVMREGVSCHESVVSTSNRRGLGAFAVTCRLDQQCYYSARH